MRRNRARLLSAVFAPLLVLAAVFAAPDSLAAQFRKPPYLIYTGMNTEMRVLWQVPVTQQCTIEWGSDTTYAAGWAMTTEYGLDHQHAYTISVLSPGALCFYRVIAGPDTFAASFRAAPPIETSTVKFFAYGDTRSYPATHDQVTEAMISVWQAEPEWQTVAVATGDLVNDGDLESHWDAEFFSPTYTNIRTYMASIPFQSAMGNHEKTGVLFRKYFPYPFVAGRYWSFDYGPVHFTLVDQYTSYALGSPQLQWIEDDLANTDRPWKVVVFHEPGWSAGGSHENNVAVQTLLQPLFEEYDVAIAFAGHNHYYARAVVAGIQHVTTGGGGAPLYAPNPTYPFIVATAQSHHYCKVAVQDSSLYFEAISLDGALLDSFQLHLHGTGVSGALPDRRPRIELGTPRPNPSSGSATVSFTLPAPARVTLRILDVAGRLVRTLVDGDMPGGTREATWDGRSDAGELVPSGVYLARLEASGDAATEKLVIHR